MCTHLDLVAVLLFRFEVESVKERAKVVLPIKVAGQLICEGGGDKGEEDGESVYVDLGTLSRTRCMLR